MKRLIILVALLIVTVLMSSCNNEFSFRGHQFGDSIEQVKKIEGDNCEIIDIDDKISLYYSEIYAFDNLSGDLVYVFENDQLTHILLGPYKLGPEIYEDTEAIKSEYLSIVGMLNRYGEMNEEKQADDGYKALWKKDKYGMVLLYQPNMVIITISSDPIKSEKFYNTLLYTDLFG